MIKIELDDLTKKKLEDNHWNWFLSHLISTYKSKKNLFQSIVEVRKLLQLKNNKELKELVIGNFFPVMQKNGPIKLQKEIEPKDKNGKITYPDDLESFLREQQPIKEENAKVNKLAQFFSYTSFKNSTKWDPYALFNLMNIDVCSYCNRQYIFTIGNAMNKTVRPELDHFCPQEKYPYLAISLYNFIPSCHICNHIKNDKDENIIYPYNEGFVKADGHKDGKFRTAFPPKKDVTNWSIREIQNLKFRIDVSDCHDYAKKERMKNSIKMFHLEEIYNKHQIEIKDLFLRYSNYCHPKRMDILRLFYKKGLMKKNEKQIDKILSIYAMKMKKVFLGLPLGVKKEQYPLRKFKEDIIEQLDETVQKMRNGK